MSKAIYTEIDAFLDTRIATIAMLDQQAAVKAITSPSYHNREMDEFNAICGVDDEIYSVAYRMRDKETLKHATLSHLPVMFMQMIKELEEQANNIPEPESFHVELNIWPYALTDEERNLIELAVQRYCGHQTNVRSVSIPYNELTPRMIRERYPFLVMYNFNEWLPLHKTVFGQCKLPQTTFLIPKLRHERSSEELEKQMGDFTITDPFERASKLLAMFMNIEFIHIGNFNPLRHWELDEMVEQQERSAGATQTHNAPTEPT